MLGDLWLEARQSLRGLRRSPDFAGVFVITIGLAVAAITTTVSILEGIVLRSVTAREPDRLAAISVAGVRTNQPGYIYAETFEAYRDTQRSFATLSMYFARYFRVETGTVAVDGVTEGVTSDYFDALGAKPGQGRFFSNLDSAALPVMVLSDRFWRRLFGDDSAVVGTTIRVAGQPVTVIGVTAPGFEGLQLDGGTDIFMPLPLMQTLSGGATTPLRASNLVGRLAPGVSVADARAELLARWPVTVESRPPSSLSPAEQESLRRQKVDVQSVASGFSPLRNRYRASILVLVGLSAALLAIACINLTGLLLARSLNQRHQLTLKLAIGASRARALCHILLDAVFLTLMGFLFAVPLVWWATQELGARVAFGRSTPLLLSMTPSGSLLAIAALMTLLVGVAIGILPAWRASRGGAPADLHSSRSVARTLGRSGRFLLVVQVALSMILLVGTGLFANTLIKLRMNQASVGAQNVLFTRITRVPGDRGPISPAYLQALLGELTSVGGVQSAALSVFFPALFQSSSVPTSRYSTAGVRQAEVTALTEFVSPGFSDTFDIPRLKGRDFTWRTTTNRPSSCWSASQSRMRSLEERRLSVVGWRWRPAQPSRSSKSSEL
jgi:predicted permease